MRVPDTIRLALVLGRGASLVAAALLTVACATTEATRPVPVETRDETGFTITQDLRVDGDVRADFERAMALLEQTRYDEGIALLEQVALHAPEATAAHINLGIAYGRVDRLEEAEASIRRALELNPRHPVAHNELGMLYRRMGRFAEARASYEAALAAYPDFHYARLNLAILCDMYLADTACALENYERYSAAVPDDHQAAMWIADLRNRTGRQETP